MHIISRNQKFIWGVPTVPSVRFHHFLFASLSPHVINFFRHILVYNTRDLDSMPVELYKFNYH